MFGNLAAGDAGKILDHLTATSAGRFGTQARRPSTRDALWQHWRGRMGLTEAQQAGLWDVVDPERDGPAGLLGHHHVGSDNAAAPPAGEIGVETVTLRFKTWEGDVREVQAHVGQTLLQVGKAHDLPSLEGTCGGNLGTSLPNFPTRDVLGRSATRRAAPCCPH